MIQSVVISEFAFMVNAIKQNDKMCQVIIIFDE
jgi:hypothetical protein